jgi:hypothetical protein
MIEAIARVLHEEHIAPVVVVEERQSDVADANSGLP